MRSGFKRWQHRVEVLKIMLQKIMVMKMKRPQLTFSSTHNREFDSVISIFYKITQNVTRHTKFAFVFHKKNQSYECKMSSTASPIDRRKSNLRTHKILALSTHLITHKSTIPGVSSTNRADMGKQFRANVTWVRSMWINILHAMNNNVYI